MFEMWIIIIALISWCMLHLNNQRSIIIYAPFNVVKILLAVVVSIALLVFFWNTDINNDIRITLIASLLVVISMLKEGISQNKVVKLGLLSESLQNIESIEIEEETDYCRVQFNKSSKNSYVLNLNCSKAELLHLLSSSSFRGNIIQNNESVLE